MANKNAKFVKQIKTFGKLSAKTANQETRKLAFGIGLKGVVMKSPVDDGTFRGNWNVGIDRADLSTSEDKQDKAGSNTISEGGTIIGQFKNGQNINISNNLPYSNRLEFGWSPQSQGMIRRTFMEMKAWLKGRNKKV